MKHFRDVMREVGLPELADISDPSTNERFIHLLNASAVGLADGDVRGFHDPLTDREMIDLFGEEDYHHGRAAKAVLSAALANRPEKTDSGIYAYQNFVAEYVAEANSPFRHVLGGTTVDVSSTDVMVDDNFIVPLKEAPKLVMEYGACLSSAGRLVQQGKMAHELGGKTFTYVPITKTHFTNRVLMNEYDNLYGDGMTRIMLNGKMYAGREDGVEQATGSIIVEQEAGGKPANVFDVILCVGEQHMTSQDIITGIGNAARLLNNDGVLIARGFENPSSNEIGITTMSEVALDSGLVEASSLGYQGHDHNLPGQSLIGEQSTRRVKSIAFKLRGEN